MFLEDLWPSDWQIIKTIKKHTSWIWPYLTESAHSDALIQTFAPRYLLMCICLCVLWLVYCAFAFIYFHVIISNSCCRLIWHLHVVWDVAFFRPLPGFLLTCIDSTAAAEEQDGCWDILNMFLVSVCLFEF